jgi:VanZ family protein
MQLKKIIFYIPAIAIMAFIAYGSLTPSEKTEAFKLFNFEISDKLIHGVFYFILTLSFLYPIYKSELNSNWNILFISAIVFLYGIVMEIIQYFFIADRTGEFYDVLANTGGIVMAVLIFKVYRHQIKKRILTL